MRKNTLAFIPLLLIAITCLTFLSSCKKDKDEESKISLSVSPSQAFINANQGEFKIFHISGSSSSKLTRLKITYRKQGDQLSTLLDSILEVKQIDFYYTFQIPTYGSQNVYLNMFFELTDVDGDVVTAAKGITVSYENYPLTEVVDNELYSRLSGHPSAYNLRAGIAVNYALPTTEDMNITDSVQVDSLSLTWISPAGGQFVRKNSFNYSNATINDLKNEFESSAKTTKLVNLAVNDIILYKQTYGIELFYAAIKITDIQNNPGSNNDKYIFNIKK